MFMKLTSTVGFICLAAALSFLSACPTPAHHFPPQPPTVSSISKYIKITYPNNDDILYVGDNITITWTSDFPEEATFRVKLDYGIGMDLRDFELGKTKNTGSFPWTVTDQSIGTKIQLVFLKM